MTLAGSIRLPEIASPVTGRTVGQPSRTRAAADRPAARARPAPGARRGGGRAPPVADRSTGGGACGLAGERPGRRCRATAACCRGVTKRFRSGFVAVDDVSFSVERGQVVGLLGENGAGKTTTMRMVLGLSRPDVGHRRGVRRRRRARCPRTPAHRQLHRGTRVPAASLRTPQPRAVLGGDRSPAPRRPARRGARDRRPRHGASGAGSAATARACGSGSRSRRRCSACPTCWCSTSRRTAWTRPRSSRCAACCARYAAGGRTVIVSSHLLARGRAHLQPPGRDVARPARGRRAGRRGRAAAPTRCWSRSTTQRRRSRPCSRPASTSAEPVGTDAVRVLPGRAVRPPPSSPRSSAPDVDGDRPAPRAAPRGRVPRPDRRAGVARMTADPRHAATALPLHVELVRQLSQWRVLAAVGVLLAPAAGRADRVRARRRAAVADRHRPRRRSRRRREAASRRSCCSCPAATW